MTDAFETQARALAHSAPMMDMGSTQAIKTIALGLRETWSMALVSERKTIAEKALEWSEYYPVGSDGRNTFVMFAAWVEARDQG